MTKHFGHEEGAWFWGCDACNPVDATFNGRDTPRTIATEDELDALPVGTVVLSDAYRYMVHGGADCGWPIAFQRWDDGLWHRGGRSGSTHPDNFLPVTVLHEPRP